MKFQPSNFLRLESTQALATAISNSSHLMNSPIDLSRGRSGGTYVHEDLAIDYAVTRYRRANRTQAPPMNPPSSGGFFVGRDEAPRCHR